MFILKAFHLHTQVISSNSTSVQRKRAIFISIHKREPLKEITSLVFDSLLNLRLLNKIPGEQSFNDERCDNYLSARRAKSESGVLNFLYFFF